MAETAIIAEMVEKVAGSEKIEFSTFRKHENIRKSIGDIIPGIKKLLTMDIMKEGFQISGRTFHEPKFATADVRAVFTTISIPGDKLRCYCIVPSNKDNINYQLNEVMYAY